MSPANVRSDGDAAHEVADDVSAMSGKTIELVGWQKEREEKA